jgi:hypothetical protein
MIQRIRKISFYPGTVTSALDLPTLMTTEIELDPKSVFPFLLRIIKLRPLAHQYYNSEAVRLRVRTCIVGLPYLIITSERI